DVLCQIDPNDGNLFHGCLPLLCVALTPQTLAHCDAVGEGWHPPHQQKGAAMVLVMRLGAE
ncbi:hypothetical protein, partial [Mesorhizobium sp.]|uniref:hypothetical protein n=1 Tax=Mesorhizobium sp. TaxID=1871066 RepID=UPI00257B2D04